MSLSKGNTVGTDDRFRIEKAIDVGGTSEVYEATDLQGILGRVALKIPNDKRRGQPDTLVLFRHEQDLFRELRCIGLPQLVHAEDDLIALQLLEGKTLRHELKDRRNNNRPFSWDEAKPLFLRFARILYGLHEKGIVHRDLKPANLFLVPQDGYELFVLDLGLALRDGKHPLHGGAGVGTDPYMAPEQCDEREGAVGKKSDIYAFGIILYETLAGDVPFRGTAELSIRQQHCAQPPNLMLLRQRGCSEELIELIGRLLAKHAEERPDTSILSRLIDEVPTVGARRRQEPPVDATSDVPDRQDRNAPGTVGMASTGSSSRGEIEARPPKDKLHWFGFPRRAALAAGAVVLAFVGLGAMSPFSRSSQRSEAPSARPRPSTDECGGRFANTAMACVPRTSFTMGIDKTTASAQCAALGAECDKDIAEVFVHQAPAHAVEVAPFGMQKLETSCNDFVRFLNRHSAKIERRPEHDPKLDKKGRPLPLDLRYLYWKGTETPLADIGWSLSCVAWNQQSQEYVVRDKKGNRPIEKVSYYAAEQFCDDLDESLPTEAQYEAVMRGSDDRTYPSGAALPSCTGTAYDQQDKFGGRKPACADLPTEMLGARDVGTSPDDLVPALGIHDLDGNVSEITSDGWADAYATCSGPCVDPHIEPLTALDAKVALRGGNYVAPAWAMRSTIRGRRRKDQLFVGVGFRCAKNLTNPTKEIHP